MRLYEHGQPPRARTVCMLLPVRSRQLTPARAPRYKDMKAGGDVNLVRSLCYDMGHVFKGNAELADALAEMKGMGRGEVGEYSFKKWWFKHADSYALPSQYASPRCPSLCFPPGVEQALPAWRLRFARPASLGWPSRPPHICVRAFRALSPALYRMACPGRYCTEVTVGIRVFRMLDDSLTGVLPARRDVS